MPIRGEATVATYVNFERVADGSGILHRCWNRVLDRDCVQKTVRISTTSAVASEPRLLEALNHPHIPPVVEAQFDPDHQGLITLIMPWYEGGSVARALVEDHRFSLHECIQIISDVLDALEYVHTRHGYVHRDIKTDNILLDSERRHGFLTDFGLAGALDETNTSPAVLATYHYMAPECAETKLHGPPADLYGVGMALFEMLNGRFQWEDMDRAQIERRVMSGHRSVPGRLLNPNAFDPCVPNSIVTATRRALRSSPTERFGSAAQMRRALNSAAVVNWRHVEGTGSAGEWIGEWPPQVRRESRDQYQVLSTTLQRGKQRGMLRLVARYRRQGSGAWRRIGIDDRTVSEGGDAEIRRFFREVEANARHRRAAR